MAGRRRKTQQLLRVARSLYASGQSVSEIAEALGVSADAVRRWRREDQTDWSARRLEATSRDPATLMRDMEALLADVIRDRTMGLAARADAAVKITGSLEKLRENLGDPGWRLDACNEITDLVLKSGREDWRAAWRDIFWGYTEQVRLSCEGEE